MPMRARAAISAALLLASGSLGAHAAEQDAAEAPYPEARVRAMLLGGFIGDAAGGPVEFQGLHTYDRPDVPFRRWKPGETLAPRDRRAHGDGLVLMSYAALRPAPEAYAHWSHDAPPGTLTDDSRHKLVVIDAVRVAAGPPTPEHLARAYLGFHRRWADEYGPELATESLCEFTLAANWVLGERDPDDALPPERMWGGLPTCAGQMALPPLAALAPGDPDAAYHAAYDAAFIDNSFARDLNAAIVAGLAAALAADPADTPEQRWAHAKSAMLETDPMRFGEVPWVQRSIARWLAFAETAAANARHRPADLIATIDATFADDIAWEAHVTFAMAAASIEFTDAHPLASVRLAIELGHDTDSTAQLAGLFMGAIHGPEAFPPRLARPVEARLRADYGVGLDELVETMSAAAQAKAEAAAR